MPLIDTEPTPAAWLADRLPRRFDDDASDPNIGPWYAIRDLLADDGALLRTWHSRLVAGERTTTAAAAATYLAGWLGGSLAGAVGHALATVDAGFVIDDTVRWHQHPDGWIDRVTLGQPGVLVTVDHPWRDQPGVTTVAGDAISQVAIERLVDVLTPVIDVCHDLGRTGRVGLWNEVADGLGLSVAHCHGVPVRSDVIETLVRAVRTPGVPWRATPSLRIVNTEGGPVYIGQKGGCCLAYTCPDGTDTDTDQTNAAHDHDHVDDHDQDEADLASEHRAYLERFPEQPGEPRYCTTCKFRDRGDCEQRQLFWIERQTAS